MNDKINTFLHSGLLEKYLMDETTLQESLMVENYIAKYPEVENAYNTLQHNLEIVAKSNAVEAPQAILDNILDELNEEDTFEKETPVINLNSRIKTKKWYHLSIAASIATLIFAGTSYFLYTQNLDLKNNLSLQKHESQVIVDEIFDLRGDIDKIMKQFKQLNNPETEKYIINGNQRAKNLKTVAYINPKERTSMIDVVSLPKLPEDQEYKIWAQLQDKMVDLGILTETDRQLKEIPYTENALGYSITIESKGNEHETATKENSVAEILLKNKSNQ
ncbi:RNA polymerase subunit sigma-70 [Mangrovimonas sp. AS39]|uniref:anti-sigma factor n=1 Tax=Mangrovimonas TaxID=1211036 RepID=UPI00141DAD2A|nr:MULTISPECIES: anti-sigma factor [Mangrovimonas]MCF1190703.1 RNA polymerase subunit sigma-70 [Mangrovimonas futianensis]MCF1194400.1 RNA polymerase subunit sigma-70 [Mangrovimonas futianensis]NIK91261.1 anti-sigma factor [Mangrovimonas sp. CR14]